MTDVRDLDLTDAQRKALERIFDDARILRPDLDNGQPCGVVLVLVGSEKESIYHYVCCDGHRVDVLERAIEVVQERLDVCDRDTCAAPKVH